MLRPCAILLLALLTSLVAASGCGPAGGAQTKISNRTADTSALWSEDLFSFAIENLNHLEDNDCEEMGRTTQQRLFALKQPQVAQATPLPNALLASWPEPDMLRQVVSRLNQWVDTQEKPAQSKLDPMLATLPGDLVKLPMVEDLPEAHFTAYDGYMLMEAVWLRDASHSKWAGGGMADELEAARSLFDWTIRNIQFDYDKPDRVPQVPWETLFLGHGTTWERAWTYILLLRQRGIDAALLALPEGNSSPATKAGKLPATAGEKKPLKPWCVGVLIGDTKNGKLEKKLYLFDPELGLPIPAPGAIATDKLGRLDVQPATLEQVVANPKLLDRLALDADAPYWAQKADLKKAVALIEASPLYLSPRAKRMEMRLTGEKRLVLNAEPSQQAARFQATGVSDVRLWELPYVTLQRRLALDPNAIIERLLAYEPFMCSPPSPPYVGPAAPLYKGRIMQLKGKYFDEKEAIAYYQKARPRTKTVLEEGPKIAKACFEFFRHRVKPEGGPLPPAEERFLKQMAGWQAEQSVTAIIHGKLAASYWLGLIEYDLGDFNAALDYFAVRTLRLEPNGFWVPGAEYNIARTLEANGQRQKAIAAYESSIVLRNHTGNLLRARWLKELDGEKSKKPEEGKPKAAKPEERKIVEKKIEEKKGEDKKGQ